MKGERLLLGLHLLPLAGGALVAFGSGEYLTATRKQQALLPKLQARFVSHRCLEGGSEHGGPGGWEVLQPTDQIDCAWVSADTWGDRPSARPQGA